MNADLIGELACFLIYMAVILGPLALAAILSDYIVPRFPKVEKIILAIFRLKPEDLEDDYEDD